MASKHDAKRAQENHWVMQQNLAKQKGGARFMPKPPQPRMKAVPAKPAPTPAPEAEAKPEGSEPQS